MIRFTSPKTGDLLYEKDSMLVSEKGEHFPVVDGIPRFVASDGHAASFGLEWKIDAPHLTDYYKHLRTTNQIRATLASLYAQDIWVSRRGNGIEARCRKPEN